MNIESQLLEVDCQHWASYGISRDLVCESQLMTQYWEGNFQARRHFSTFQHHPSYQFIQPYAYYHDISYQSYTLAMSARELTTINDRLTYGCIVSYTG